MPRKKREAGRRKNGVKDFRHEGARRKNNPPAGIAPTYEVRERKVQTYAYDPHLDPQLQWAGKAEHTSFEVDVVSLHIHERISTKAILDTVRRPVGACGHMPLQPDLFGETPLPADQEVEFYKHEVGWANRLILGDSLLVMNSLLVKEGMAGKVQMIYVDPPYGIKYASNFQPRIDRRDVKDKDEDLTHEPEQIKAYRDTWKLGIHSYLTYLRDRLLLARELLTESGSIFVQINDENLHLVRCLMDEVFGAGNFVALIPFRKKTMPFGTNFIEQMSDFILWYAKQKTDPQGRPVCKYRKLFRDMQYGPESGFSWCELPDGSRNRITSLVKEQGSLPPGARLFTSKSLEPSGPMPSGMFKFRFEGKEFECPKNGYGTTPEGMKRLAAARRLIPAGRLLRYVLYADDKAWGDLTAPWHDTVGADNKEYVVQTNVEIVKRCILMTTDPGDLVFDPTCGSGTTAFVAEKWGRRWITCDTSRVALAIARQRLMTAKFDYYELRDPERGPAGGFIYETVPHITLESIAKNTEIDAIAAKYQPEIDGALEALNRALGKAWKEWEVPREIPHPVWPKEAWQAYHELLTLKGKVGACGHMPLLAVDSERTSDLLQTIYRLTGHLWKDLGEVPDPMPAPDWPDEAKEALRRFWELKRKKRQEIDESIARNAPQETLYDRPQVKRGVVRVSGPFTVEAIPVPAVEDPTQAPIPQFEEQEARERVSDRGGDYLTDMLNLLKQQGGVLFPGGKKLALNNLRPLNLGYLHAEAEAQQDVGTRGNVPDVGARGNVPDVGARGNVPDVGARGNVPLRVAISFGPQHGPVTAHQVQEAIPTARMNGYQVLIFAGFAFDPEAQALIQKVPVAGLQVHFANIAPDVLVGDLLKTTRASQIFTVFGQPDVQVAKQQDDTFVVTLRGVDIYDPLTGEVSSARGEDVAAWFLDADYDGKTFKISQAFFPGDPGAWEKLQRALKAQIDPEAFKQMRGTVSFPFKPGEHQRIAVKVIDFRGNEVVRVVKLQEIGYDR